MKGPLTAVPSLKAGRKRAKCDLYIWPDRFKIPHQVFVINTSYLGRRLMHAAHPSRTDDLVYFPIDYLGTEHKDQRQDTQDYLGRTKDVQQRRTKDSTTANLASNHTKDRRRREKRKKQMIWNI